MDLLGLTPIVDGRTSFELTPALVRFDGQLFGGTGLAVVVEAIEQLTGRDALWATVQFVDTAAEGETLDVVAEELAHGGTTSQVRVTATHEGRVVLAGLGSSARTREGSFAATFATISDVVPPEECGPLTFGAFEPPPEMKARGPFAIGDYRVAPGPNDSHLVWVRIDGVAVTRSFLAFVADFIPSAMLRSVGKFGGGTSLDNSMRFGPASISDEGWVLLESDPYFADNGFLHGAARLWTPDGTLVAIASQSAVARIFDADLFKADPSS